MTKKEKQLDRAKGALIGLAVGDAVGTTLEFQSRHRLQEIDDMVGGGPFRLEAGQWTDDTSMALCLAESLVELGAFDGLHILDKWVQWMDQGYYSVKGYCFDIGNATRKALTHYKQTGRPIRFADENTQSNGSIMRLAPVALAAGNLESAGDLGLAQGALTHPHKNCVQACFRFSSTLYSSIQGGGQHDPEHHCNSLEYLKPYGLHDCDDWFERLGEVPAEQMPSTGYVVDTIRCALWALSLAETFEDGLLIAVNLGGDSDTIGAVYGQLAGALWGLSSIPTHWTEKLWAYDLMLEFAEILSETNITQAETPAWLSAKRRFETDIPCNKSENLL